MYFCKRFRKLMKIKATEAVQDEKSKECQCYTIVFPYNIL